MTGRAFVAVVLAVAASTLSACGASNSGGAGTPNDAGWGSGSGGSPADASGGTGSGGSGSGGSGGTSTTGSGGGTGTGGAGMDAGTTVDAGADARPMPCVVDIKPVSSVDFSLVPAGPSATLRVRGVLRGNPLPAQPVWSWTVTVDPNREPVPTSMPDQDPAVIEFPITREAHYLISVTVTTTGNPVCSGMQAVKTTLTPVASYWVRVLPPAGVVNPPPALANLAPYEQLLAVSAGQAPAATFAFNHTITVRLQPIDNNQNKKSVLSYVLITSPSYSWSSEGDTLAEAFTAPLIDDPRSLYDVLIAPIASQGVPAIAPILFPGNSAAAVDILPLALEQGVPVSGSLGIQGGAAVVGATVVLRAGVLPSTIGKSASDGAYSLLARAGRFSAVIVPPDAAMLPEAHVDADASAGIDLPASPTAPVTVGFSWRGDLVAGTLAARFVTGGGGPAAAIDVQLDSDLGSLPDVGTLRVAGSASGAATFTATGVVHRTATTDATGAVSFAGLPRATYQLVAIPPVSSTDGLTATAVDLTAGAPSAPVIVSLAPKVVVSGTISNAPAGSRIITLDDDPTLGHVFPAAAVGGGGAFSLRLDPQHPYHLLVDPPAGQMASRVQLGAVQTATSAYDMGQRKLPHMLPFTGFVHAPDGATPVAGAHVQVFCVGPGPDCIDTNDLGSKDPLPLIEGVTQPGGAFALWVPDPALPQ